MNRKHTVKNKVFVIATSLVALASVAYASFASTLNINGTGTATGNWDVKITSITLATGTGATNHNGVAPSVAGDGLSATFNVDLAYPGSTATYAVTITNNGNIPAKLVTLTNLTTINSAAPSYITYAVNGVAVNDVIAAGGTATANVTVTWSASDTTSANGTSKAATINFGYVQNS